MCRRGISEAGISGAGISEAGISGAGISGAGISEAGISEAGISGAGISGAGISGAGGGVRHGPEAGDAGRRGGTCGMCLEAQGPGDWGHQPLVLHSTDMAEQGVQVQTAGLKCWNEKGVLLDFELCFRAVHYFLWAH